MSNEYLSLKSEISKAKNLGSSGSGSHHWLMQRLSAAILLPLFIWLFYFLYTSNGLNKEEVIGVIALPYNLICMNMLISVAIYHSTIGMQVVVEDYVSTLCIRNAIIIAMRLFSFITTFMLLGASVYFLVQI